MPGHLKKLPVKSFDVAPGDVIGGLIYVMDKPLGIEEGMVGISIESEQYRQFVESTYVLLEKIRKKEITLLEAKKEMPDIEALSKRYETLYKQKNGFQGLDKKALIDTLLMDKVHEKKRHGASWKEFKNMFFSFSKYHEMKGWQSYYVNKGTGGLLFEAYKNKCGIKKNDHFAVHIGKLTETGDKAYMIKQDGEMALGGTGPGWRKMLKTNTGKSLQKLANPFVVLLTGGLSLLAFGAGMLGWRAYYLSKNKPAVSNAEAIIESLSTKIAAKRGMAAQEIDTVDGAYENNAPKVATIVTWANGCRDLSGKLSGSTDWSSVVVTWDKNDMPVKVDDKGNIIRTNEKDAKGNIISYEIIDAKGKVDVASKAQYDAAKAVSDDRIAGLGESLISFISMGDRDGIGKAGQNKAIMKLDPPQGNKRFQFFGIDFGKSYKSQNTIVQSLRDDFSFDNPASRQSRFVNYSMLYDNPLRDKMKGIYLLSALRGEINEDFKEVVAKAYEAKGDKVFADKLRAYPASVGGIDSDLKLIDAEIKKYEDLANKPDATEVQKEQYQHYAQRLKGMKDIAKETDKVILDKFAERRNLTPDQIDILDNIEKLTARETHSLSPDGKVQLNHLRVESQDRCAWQLQDNKNGTFNLVCQETQNLLQVKQRLLALKDPNINDLLAKAKVENKQLLIADLTKEQLAKLSQHLTEDKVAKTRDLPYRTQAMLDKFHERIKEDEKLQAKPEVQLGPQRFDNPIVNVNLARKLASADIAAPNVEHHHPKPMGYMYKARQPILMDRVSLPVLTQHGEQFEDIQSFLSKAENKVKLGIVHIQAFETAAFKHNKGLVLTFKVADTKNEAKFFLEQTPTGIRYCFPKELNQSDFKLTSKVLSEFIAANNKGEHEPEISPLKPAQKNAVEQAMVASGIRFKVDIAPHLKREQGNHLSP